jgi:hypothetical protein
MRSLVIEYHKEKSDKIKNSMSTSLKNIKKNISIYKKERNFLYFHQSELILTFFFTSLHYTIIFYPFFNFKIFNFQISFLDSSGGLTFNFTLDTNLDFGFAKGVPFQLEFVISFLKTTSPLSNSNFVYQF